MGGGGTTPEPELEDLREESEVVRNELTDEVDIGLVVIRNLFRIGEFSMGYLLSPSPPPPPLYTQWVTRTPRRSVTGMWSRQYDQK